MGMTFRLLQNPRLRQVQKYLDLKAEIRKAIQLNIVNAGNAYLTMDIHALDSI